MSLRRREMFQSSRLIFIMQKSRIRWRWVMGVVIAGWMVPGLVWGHVSTQPSVHDTVAGILDRLQRTLSDAQLRRLDIPGVLALLSPRERDVLSRQHVVFRVNAPVVVTLLCDQRVVEGAFWLGDSGFRSTGQVLEHGSLRFGAWERSFEAGEIGLGVNSVRGGGEHYGILVRPRDTHEALVISGLYPEQLRVADFANGARLFADREEMVTNVPSFFLGQKVIQTLRDRRDDGRLLQVFRWTEFPGGKMPDQVLLTWSGDPSTSQAIQWRTGPEVKSGYAMYAKRSDYFSPEPRGMARQKARSEVLEDRRLMHAGRVRRHTVELTGLAPGTTYVYAVGDGSRGGWTEWAEFTTAPDRVVPFSFVYMGDAQNGLDRWGSLVRRAFRERPDAAFYLMAGDLVNRGNERDDWDSFFANARGIFDRRPLVPVIGNHECQGGHPRMYLRQFALPRNGPPGVEAERVYAFHYSNALLVILDSNLDPGRQSAWLDEQLGRSTATWKFVSFHHPAYSSAPGRDNAKLRAEWVPIFDRHHVDMVLQGHDHAYLRTHPLKGNARAPSSAEGTTYVVSVSGTKFYSLAERDYTSVGFAKVSTYQVLDIQVSGNRLVYRAYDLDGQVRDEFIIEK